MIHVKDLDHAIDEAKRFLRVAEKLKSSKNTIFDSWCDGGVYAYGKLPAAVKRASLDLSSALVRLRK
jgi:hypothetical protein